MDMDITFRQASLHASQLGERVREAKEISPA
jgi:hypothetical protein